jgi:hypothetical protein
MPKNPIHDLLEAPRAAFRQCITLKAGTCYEKNENFWQLINTINHLLSVGLD